MKDDAARNQEVVEEELLLQGFVDHRWIQPSDLVVSQWVRIKCMYGCPDYGKNLSCPPHVPSVVECRDFFGEYELAVLIHMVCDAPTVQTHEWVRLNQQKLLDLEKKVFLEGYERAFLLSFESCNRCSGCPSTVDGCRFPYTQRPSVEAFAVDMFSSVRKFGYTLNVKKHKGEKADRFALLLLK